MEIGKHDSSVEQRKFGVPDRNRTNDPPEQMAGAVSTELREIMEGKVS